MPQLSMTWLVLRAKPTKPCHRAANLPTCLNGACGLILDIMPLPGLEDLQGLPSTSGAQLSQKVGNLELHHTVSAAYVVSTYSTTVVAVTVGCFLDMGYLASVYKSSPANQKAASHGDYHIVQTPCRIPTAYSVQYTLVIVQRSLGA